MRISQRPVPAAELVLVLSFALLACKLGKSKDDPDARPLPDVPSAPVPTPAAPPVPVPVPAAPAPAPTTPPAADATAATGTTATTGSAAVKPVGTTGGANTTGSAVKPTSATAAATTTSTSTTGGAAKDDEKDDKKGTTGGNLTVSPECLTKCGNRFRDCLQDAKLGDDVTTKCQGAFKACQKACIK